MPALLSPATAASLSHHAGAGNELGLMKPPKTYKRIRPAGGRRLAMIGCVALGVLIVEEVVKGLNETVCSVSQKHGYTMLNF